MEIIAAATMDDLAGLCDLLGILFGEELEFSADRARQEAGLRLILESPTVGRLFVAHVDGRIVGMVSLLFTVSTAVGAWVCWLEDMVVEPSMRSRGMAARLLERAVEFCADQRLSANLALDRRRERACAAILRAGGFARSEMRRAAAAPLKRDGGKRERRKLDCRASRRTCWRPVSFV